MPHLLSQLKLLQHWAVTRVVRARCFRAHHLLWGSSANLKNFAPCMTLWWLVKRCSTKFWWLYTSHRVLPWSWIALMWWVFSHERPFHGFFQFLTWTSNGKSVNTTGKRILKLIKSPSLKVICWKLTKTKLLKGAKFYSHFYGEEDKLTPLPPPPPSKRL